MDKKQRFLDGLKDALIEVNEVQAGIKTGKPARQFIEEVRAKHGGARIGAGAK